MTHDKTARVEQRALEAAAIYHGYKSLDDMYYWGRSGEWSEIERLAKALSSFALSEAPSGASDQGGGGVDVTDRMYLAACREVMGDDPDWRPTITMWKNLISVAERLEIRLRSSDQAEPQRVGGEERFEALISELQERATYLEAFIPEGLSTIERQSMETMFRAARSLAALRQSPVAAEVIYYCSHCACRNCHERREPPTAERAREGAK